MLKLQSVRMPSLGTVGSPKALNRGEWEKLGRLAAEVENDVLEGKWEEWTFSPHTPDRFIARIIRGDIEEAIRKRLQVEGFDTKFWIIQAILAPDEENPAALDTWEVRLWFTQVFARTLGGSHVPTISEKIAEAPPNGTSDKTAMAAEQQAELEKNGPEGMERVNVERLAKLAAMHMHNPTKVLAEANEAKTKDLRTKWVGETLHVIEQTDGSADIWPRSDSDASGVDFSGQPVNRPSFEEAVRSAKAMDAMLENQTKVAKAEGKEPESMAEVFSRLLKALAPGRIEPGVPDRDAYYIDVTADPYREGDFEVEPFRVGDDVSKDSTGIRITHKSTGTVTEATERSRHASRAKAMTRMREKLDELLEASIDRDGPRLDAGMIIPDVSEMPCAAVVRHHETADYNLGCIRPYGHEGDHHAHLWKDGTCSCGEEAPPPDPEEDVGRPEAGGFVDVDFHAGDRNWVDGRDRKLGLTDSVEIVGHIFVAEAGPRGGWEPSVITIDPEAHECRLHPQGTVLPFWGLYTQTERDAWYPDRPNPKSTSLMGVQSHLPCSVSTDPNWTEDRGHGDDDGYACCATVFWLVIAAVEPYVYGPECYSDSGWFDDLMLTSVNEVSDALGWHWCIRDYPANMRVTQGGHETTREEAIARATEMCEHPVVWREGSLPTEETKKRWTKQKLRYDPLGLNEGSSFPTKRMAPCPSCGEKDIEVGEVADDTTWSNTCPSCSAIWGVAKMDPQATQGAPYGLYTFHHTGEEVRALTEAQEGAEGPAEVRQRSIDDFRAARKKRDEGFD